MSSENRPVDLAMQENRPEKQKMRSLWLEKVKDVAKNYPDSSIPLYLTLPGSEGHDINLLIEEGLIKVTEVNSIAEESQGMIIAVEEDNEAVLNLQKKFAGLLIKDVNFQQLIRGEAPFAWPTGEDMKVCRSRIINLDLNSILKCNERDEQIRFPILEWIKKLCQIHTNPHNIDWTLFLTLHGEINWSQNVIDFTMNFLIENFERETEFRNSCREFLGDDLFKNVIEDTETNIGELPWSSQQKYLMLFVPKYISKLVHTEGWKIKTEYNLRYGGTDEKAPMVSWIMNFEFNPEDAAEPDRIYRESLRNILQRIGIIDQNGEIDS